jgi:hypothetical protein
MTELHVQVPDDVAERLAGEAGRRGVAVDVVLTELLAARLPAAQHHDHESLDAFIGFGSSGITEPFDVHTARRELYERRVSGDS